MFQFIRATLPNSLFDSLVCPMIVYNGPGPCPLSRLSTKGGRRWHTKTHIFVTKYICRTICSNIVGVGRGKHMEARKASLEQILGRMANRLSIRTLKQACVTCITASAWLGLTYWNAIYNYLELIIRMEFSWENFCTVVLGTLMFGCSSSFPCPSRTVALTRTGIVLRCVATTNVKRKNNSWMEETMFE